MSFDPSRVLSIVKKHAAAALSEIEAVMAARPGLLVPAYFSPSNPGWAKLAGAAPRLPVVAIANPASGPGQAIDAGYTRVIADLVAAGGTVLGYVATGRGVRDPAQVEAEIKRWASFYPAIRGIFFDQLSNLPEHLDLYARYQRAVAAVIDRPMTVGNNNALEAYAEVLSVLVVAETSADRMAARMDGLPSWVRGGAADDRIAALCHACPASLARAMATRMHDAGVGWIYITDDVMPNPWNSVPTYLEDLISAVATALAV